MRQAARLLRQAARLLQPVAQPKGSEADEALVYTSCLTMVLPGGTSRRKSDISLGST
jgi:hypothetical protein